MSAWGHSEGQRGSHPTREARGEGAASLPRTSLSIGCSETQDLGDRQWGRDLRKGPFGH